MRKVFLLYQNEMGKTLRKVSILVVIILLFVFIGGCALIRKGTETINGIYRLDYGEMADRFDKYAEDYKEDVSKMRALLETIDPVNEPEKYAEYASTIAGNFNEQKRNELLGLLYHTAERSIKNDRAYESMLYSTSDRIHNALYFDFDTPVKDPEMLAAEEERINSTAETLTQEIAQLESMLKAVTFRELLEERINYAAVSDADGSYDLYKEVYGWMDKYMDKINVSGNEPNYILEKVDNYVNKMVSLKKDAEKSPDQQGVSFTEESIRREAAILEYSLKNGTVLADAVRDNSPNNNRDIMTQMCSMGTFIIAAFVIMLAGSSISSEMNNGSIKSLIIAPVRRGKIFAAKGLMLLTVQTALLLYEYLIALLFTGTLFGFRNFGTVVYYAFGAAHGMPYLAAAILSLLLDGLAIGLFAALALALSSLTHNTAVSVTLPLLGIFGGLLAELIMLLGGGRPYIAALLPVHNLANLHRITGVPSIFEVFNSELSADAAVTPLFSWIYVILLLGALVWCAYDAFCRKDIT